MSDDSTGAPTDRVYATGGRLNPWHARSEEDAELTELIRILRERNDHGATLWRAVWETVERVPDRPQPVPRNPVRETQDQVVYYLRFGDRIKIGTTGNLPKRLASTPHDALLGVERGGYALERQRHVQFAEYRIRARSEWFHVHDALLVHIEGLPVMNLG